MPQSFHKLKQFMMTRRRAFLSSLVARSKPHLLAISFGLLLAVGTSSSSATDVVFSSGGYVRTGDEETLNMSGIENESPNTSGTLRMELWAFPTPYAGSSGSQSVGYRLAVSQPLGTLNGDSSFATSPITEISYFTPAPAGTYYLCLALCEYADASVDDGFVFDDYANGTSPTTFGAVDGADFGDSNAVQVGQGYFYDSDLGYLFPFFDGWVYFETLNRYFYFNIGTDFTTGIYIYDLTRSSWTYTEQSFWPYVYYFNGTGWVDTGYN